MRSQAVSPSFAHECRSSVKGIRKSRTNQALLAVLLTTYTMSGTALAGHLRLVWVDANLAFSPSMSAAVDGGLVPLDLALYYANADFLLIHVCTSVVNVGVAFTLHVTAQLRDYIAFAWGRTGALACLYDLGTTAMVTLPLILLDPYLAKYVCALSALLSQCSPSSRSSCIQCYCVRCDRATYSTRKHTILGEHRQARRCRCVRGFDGLDCPL